MKQTKYQVYAFVQQLLTMRHWIRLSLLCSSKWTRKSGLPGTNISEQYSLLYEHIIVYCVYRKIYGVLSLFMELYLCLWNSIFVYEVLSMSMGFYLCLWGSIFVYGFLSLSMEFYLCLCVQIMCTNYAHKSCVQIMCTKYAYRSLAQITLTNYAYKICVQMARTNYACKLGVQIMRTN